MDMSTTVTETTTLKNILKEDLGQKLFKSQLFKQIK